MQCPKCSQTMTGPYYQEATNELEHVCTCGFRKREPAHDTKDKFKGNDYDKWKEALSKIEAKRNPPCPRNWWH